MHSLHLSISPSLSLCNAVFYHTRTAGERSSGRRKEKETKRLMSQITLALSSVHLSHRSLLLLLLLSPAPPLFSRSGSSCNGGPLDCGACAAGCCVAGGRQTARHRALSRRRPWRASPSPSLSLSRFFPRPPTLPRSLALTMRQTTDGGLFSPLSLCSMATLGRTALRPSAL